jgi:hypothetical protein
MDDLLKTRFFSLLYKISQKVTNQKMQHAYEIFVIDVLTLNQTETDYRTIFRSLNLTRIEFQSLQAQILYEQGEKCPKISLLAESNFSD